MNNKKLNIKQIPIFTNKGNVLHNNKYTFLVNTSFTKTEIKKFIVSFYKINILKINTSILPKKIKKINKFSGTKSTYKKVIVTSIKNQNTNLVI